MYAAFFSIPFGVFIWSDEDQGLVGFVADISDTDRSVPKEVQDDLTPKFFYLFLCYGYDHGTGSDTTTV